MSISMLEDKSVRRSIVDSGWRCEGGAETGMCVGVCVDVCVPDAVPARSSRVEVMGKLLEGLQNGR